MRISLLTLAVFVQICTASGYAPAQTDKKSDAFWFRERSDGIIEFTNVSPVGSRWKVLFKTGPGKARALRGLTDRIPARDRSPERFSRYEQHIQEELEYYGVPVALVHAVIKTESDYDPKVVSSVGAMGLMQLMPQTAASMGVTDPFDPRQSILGGSRYLQVLARRFCKTAPPSNTGSRARFVCSEDEHIKVISGYHAGPGAVEKYGGMPPYRTTRSYVATVLSRFEENLRRQGVGRGAMVGGKP